MFTKDDVFRLPWELQIRRRDDVLLLMLRDSLVELSESAALVVRSVDGRATLEQIAARLAAEYGLEPAEALGDVVELVGALLPYEMLVRA
ncbi:PqqD family protein [Kitasatospora sp. NPDC002522]